jgi:hypothetical protein
LDDQCDLLLKDLKTFLRASYVVHVIAADGVKYKTRAWKKKNKKNQRENDEQNRMDERMRKDKP